MLQTHFKIIQNEAKWKKCKKSPFFELLRALWALGYAVSGPLRPTGGPYGRPTPGWATHRAQKPTNSTSKGPKGLYKFKKG